MRSQQGTEWQFASACPLGAVKLQQLLRGVPGLNPVAMANERPRLAPSAKGRIRDENKPWIERELTTDRMRTTPSDNEMLADASPWTPPGYQS